MGELADAGREYVSPQRRIEELEAEVARKHQEAKLVRATTCQQPSATLCASLWEADHQQRALRERGLDEEFPFGCDSIGKVADELLRTRKVNEELEAKLACLSDLRPALAAAEAEARCYQQEIAQSGTAVLCNDATVDGLTKLHAQQQERIAELQQALAPFALIAQQADPRKGDFYAGAYVQLGHCRRAKEVLRA